MLQIGEIKLIIQYSGDQGSHFTNQDYLDLLIKHNVNVGYAKPADVYVRTV